MSGNLFDDVDDSEDIFNEKPKVINKEKSPDPLEDEDIFGEKPKVSGKEKSPDLFAELNQESQMTLFSPGKGGKLFDFGTNEGPGIFDRPSLFDDLPPQANGEDNEETGTKLVPTEFDPLADHDPDDFEIIDPKEAPSAEEAEKQLEEIRLETERRKKEEKEKEELEKAQQERDEATDGGTFSRIVFGNTCLNNESETEPLTTTNPPFSPPLTDSYEDKNSQLLADAQKQIAELTANLRQAQSENAAMKSEVNQLRQQLDEEREKTKKLETTIKEKDAEIASLKESSTSAGSGKTTSKPPPARKTSATNVSSTGATKSASSPRTSAKLRSEAENKKNVTSVADAVKRFSTPSSDLSIKKPSPPARPRQTVHSKPEKPAAAHKDTSATKLTTSRPPSGTTTTSKERTSSVSSQEGTTSTAASKRESAEKALQAKEHEKERKPSPPKPLRHRARPETSQNPDPSPQMNQKDDTRSALDAIKVWEEKSNGKGKSPSEETNTTAFKKPLSGQLSSPIVSTTSKALNEDSTPIPETTDSTVDEQSIENKPPVEKVEEEKPVLRQTGANNAMRKFKSASTVEPSRRFGSPQIEKCEACKKTVYQLERLQADGKIFHKSCFRCTHCKKVVGLGTYAANKGEIFCKTHFKMLFKIKGNYDEGFGRSQHKTKWAEKDSPGPEPETLTALTQ